MTNGAGAVSGPPASYASGPSTGTVPRRMSYASVASGAAQQPFPNPSRSGAFSHLANTTPSNSYPPQYQSEPRRSRTYSGQEAEMNTNGSVPFGSTWRKSAPLPAYSRQYANIPGYAIPGSIPFNSFFIPSYLRHSRYVSKLEAAHKAKARAQREMSSAPSTRDENGALSTSGGSSMRITPSHRGMTYDIVEGNPPKDEDHLMSLPSKLSDVDKYPGLDLSTDGCEVRYNGVTTKIEMEAAMVRADFPIPLQCGIYYFEVEIKSKTKEGMIAVGFSTQKASLERLPGWETESWAYHGDDGKTFCGENQPKIYGSPFGTGDVIGCGLNFHTGQAFFTKNGNDLGVAFRELKNIRPFPAIGMKKHAGAMASINFGQRPFIFDIEDVMLKQQRMVQLDISRTKDELISRLHPPSDESTLLQELVANYLAHDGYVETARAFAAETRTEQRALNVQQDAVMDGIEDEDDNLEAVNRQKIRASILEGDMDTALNDLANDFPDVFFSSKYNEIVFRLRCRKWIELIRRSNDLNRSVERRSSRSFSTISNGLNYPVKSAKLAVDDVFDQDMELDDEPEFNGYDDFSQKGGDAVDNDTEAEKEESQQLLREAMEYGTQLMRDYGNAYDKEAGHRQARALNDIFSLIAYNDAKTSVYGHLLDPAGRVAVAEELNSAILVSLNRSPSAALERLYKQTEALITELSQDGGAAAFVNLQEAKSL